MHNVFYKFQEGLIFIFCLSIMLSPNFSVAADGSSLKKLFYSKAERKEIDNSRFKSTKYLNSDYTNRNEPGNGSLKTAGEAKKKQETLVIEGYVKREDGKNVIWFNDTNTLNGEPSNENIKLRPRNIGKTGIRITSSSKKVVLKPGQVLQITSGKIQEQYELQDSSARVKIEK